MNKPHTLNIAKKVIALDVSQLSIGWLYCPQLKNIALRVWSLLTSQEFNDWLKLLHDANIEAIFRKGTDHKIDSYSAFFDNNKKKSTGLNGYLKEKGITDVYLCGLAADFCVAYSAIDAIYLDYNTYYIKDATKPIAKASFYEMVNTIKEKGGYVIDSSKLI